MDGHPLISVVSTTGISQKRDVPLAMWPFYHFMLATPHADKKVMEEKLQASKERLVVVRPSFLVDGDCKEKQVKSGFEDFRTGEVVKELAPGYVISRGAVGRWIFGEVLDKAEKCEVEGKIAMITW